ncbi:MAG: hypothetical protein D3908_11375, partial [Candidatus Electrothrix sp. AUS4]|nr:hypothetical protein [Candidatus Electrothrix sp. AUS4]
MLKTIPLISLIHVNAAPPSLQDNTADLDRLKLALAESLPESLRTCAIHIPFACIAALAAAFRAADFTGYAVV